MTTPIADHTHRKWRSRVWNVVGEAVEEELLPYKELFTTVVLEQVLVAAATSCFMFAPAAILVMDKFNCKSDEFNCKSDEFNCKRDEFNCKTDKFNCKRDEFNCKRDEFNCKSDELNCKRDEFNCKVAKFNCKNL